MSDTTELPFLIFSILYRDVNESISNLNDRLDDSNFEFLARSYFRAYASWVEGCIYIYKDIFKKGDQKWYKDLPTESQLYLFEYDWAQKNSGQPFLLSKKIRTLDNLKGLFFISSLIFDDFNVDYEKSNWSDVVFFYKKRDRMMHPKSIDCLLISKHDVEICERGRNWLLDQFKNINTSITKKIGNA